METREFKPSPQYLVKLRLLMSIIAVLILAGGALLGWLMSLDRNIGARGGWTVVAITAACDALWWVPGMLLSGPYYRSLHYQVQEDRIIVHAGVWTRSVKHVPYRTVTNLTVKRGLLDRWLGLGTLEVQTAGMSGSGGAEQSLVGLEDAQEVYAIVAGELQRFRGGMAPTAAEAEEAVPASPQVLAALLEEVRAIRRLLEQGG